MRDAPRRRCGAFGVAVLALAVAVALTGCTGSSPRRSASPSGPVAGSAATLPPSSSLPPTDVSQDPTVEVVKRVAPSVVNVTTSIVRANPLGGAEQGEAWAQGS